ncbi:hypothetical protein ACP8Y2_24600 [Herpetosiphon llansteffanensis]
MSHNTQSRNREAREVLIHEAHKEHEEGIGSWLLAIENRGNRQSRNNPQHTYLGLVGDENPLRFPPAEGRKGGESKVSITHLQSQKTQMPMNSINAKKSL